CSAIAIIAAPTMRTSTQERWYSPHCTNVALGSAKMNLPATKRARIYRKPGVYLSGPLLGVPWRYAAVAELAIAPSELLASALAIDFPRLPGAARTSAWAPNAFRGEPITLLQANQRKGNPHDAVVALGHGRRPRAASGAPR